MNELTRILHELVRDPETEFIVTPHFRLRMRERGIELVDIASTLSRGAVTEDQGHGKHGDVYRVQVKDDKGWNVSIIIDMDQNNQEIWLITTI